MSRTLFVIALSLLFVEFLSAADKETPDTPDKKPKVQADGVKKENPDAPVKNPKAQPDAVKKEKPDASGHRRDSALRIPLQFSHRHADRRPTPPFSPP